MFQLFPAPYANDVLMAHPILWSSKKKRNKNWKTEMQTEVSQECKIKITSFSNADSTLNSLHVAQHAKPIVIKFKV